MFIMALDDPFATVYPPSTVRAVYGRPRIYQLAIIWPANMLQRIREDFGKHLIYGAIEFRMNKRALPGNVALTFPRSFFFARFRFIRVRGKLFAVMKSPSRINLPL